MTDLRSFGKTMKLRAVDVEKNTDAIVRKVVLAVDTAVVMATPVDTGRARANWRASLQVPNSSEAPTPSSPAAGAAQALNEGQQVVATYKGGKKSPTVFIQNNLPYIEPLNRGHSKQAPANFVHQAILAAIRAVQRTRVTTRR